MITVTHDERQPDTAIAAAHQAKNAARTLRTTPSFGRAEALHHIAAALVSGASRILAANSQDLELATAAGLGVSLIQRLRLNPDKINDMATQVCAVAAQDDPIGRLLSATQLDDGLVLHQVSCPLGVILAIIEARPDAISQIAALAIKSGNTVLLKVGTEAKYTAGAVIEIMHDALVSHGVVPPDAVTLVDGRAAIDVLLQKDDLIDLVIPRGSTAMVRSIMARTRIPVMGHAAGVCHIYVDAAADVDMAITILLDAKIQYPAACNSVETALVHASIAPRLLGQLVDRLAAAGVEVRGCSKTQTCVTSRTIRAATSDDWGAEYSDLVLAIRVVDDIDAAIAHIGQYGSGHTEGIVTSDATAAAYFLARVDAAGVFHNASTRFADGYRYGLGAEVGISTGKLHARGPVGLAGLTTYKYLLYGDGHIVASYVGAGARTFQHVPLLVTGPRNEPAAAVD